MSQERDMLLRLQGVTMAASLLEEWSKAKVEHVTEARSKAWREAANSLRSIMVQKLEWPAVADEIVPPITGDLAGLVDKIHEHQVAVGYWGMDGEHIDYSPFFSEIHAKVSKAFEAHSETEDPRMIFWVNPETGAGATPGSGIPHGLPVNLAEVVFEVLGFMKQLGIDTPRLFSYVLKAEADFRPSIGENDFEDDEGDGEDDGDESGDDDANEEETVANR